MAAVMPKCIYCESARKLDMLQTCPNCRKILHRLETREPKKNRSISYTQSTRS